MQGYNALYKSGTYCIQLSSAQDKEPKNSAPPISTLRSDSLVPDTWNQTDKRLPVILADLPMIGGHPKIHRRADGVRCAINIYTIEEPIRPDPELVNRELIEQLLKESSKPTDDSTLTVQINQFRHADSYIYVAPNLRSIRRTTRMILQSCTFGAANTDHNFLFKRTNQLL